ncbi:hypothetical protein [Cereibacter johrii]|uniref:Uncharacterized protein n=1 Tax=Cereibacter johrii TaxID=445629 RepID=A0ABX5J4F5_9RHOB|nr:hypothetical protein [Cereibacter johrii]ODM43327.1 hypothetical protein A9O63_07930 [Cereibacter johrii]PTM75592.1 hypothetical protein C8J29_11172 [Cereibacter johrii]
MTSEIARSALIGLGLLFSAPLALAESVSPDASGVSLVVIGNGVFGSDDFAMTGLNIVYGSGPDGAQFDSSLEGLEWACDDADCTSRSASYEGIENWSVVQTVRACGQADCTFSSQVGLQRSE